MDEGREQRAEQEISPARVGDHLDSTTKDNERWCQIQVHSGQSLDENPVKNSNKGEVGVGLGQELLRGQSRLIGYNNRSKALTPCVDSGQDKRAGTRDTEWVT